MTKSQAHRAHAGHLVQAFNAMLDYGLDLKIKQYLLKLLMRRFTEDQLHDMVLNHMDDIDNTFYIKQIDTQEKEIELLIGVCIGLFSLSSVLTLLLIYFL